MTKIKLKLLIVVGIALLFVGCTQPSFSPYNKGVLQVYNKLYRIPKQTIYINTPSEYSAVQKVHLCSKNGLFWTSNRSLLSGVGAYNDTSASIIKNAEKIRESMKLGYSGCSYPLSKKETNQIKANIAKQQKINNDPRVIAARANQSAAMMNYQAATATKNVSYNVNHSGFVNYSGSMYHY